MDTFPGYQVDELLYEGGKSLVYRGYNKKDNRPVVLKILNKEYPTPNEIARFTLEYEIASGLNLNGVVQPYTLEKYGHSLAIVMEDFGGESLDKQVTQTLSIADFLNLALTVTDILGQIHQQHIMHKDINPTNLIVAPLAQPNPILKGQSKTDKWQVKIIDFGISTVLSHENATVRSPNILEGTLAYISPEQTGRMNRAIDYRTDFYSLGVTFYQLLTGQLPFQASDPMELVHAHIARQPFTPHALNSDIPKSLSELIMKLMAKNAEDRYQSAHGIKSDLEQCRQQWQASETIISFPIGQHDATDTFQIPQKLYGRQRDVETLLAAFDRVGTAAPEPGFDEPKTDEQPAVGRTEVMLVAGYSGIGKSSLIYEVHKPIMQKRGYFITGKLDQFKRNNPYSSLIQAFQGLIQQLLTESEAQIAYWRQTLLATFGPNGQVITEVIPEVELIIGPQPAVAEVSPTEAQNRFNLIFSDFVRVFAQPIHPLVIFLDDLQWVDSATLNLLKLLVTDPDTRHLLVIGAYRDNEISPSHPLQVTLTEIEETDTPVKRIFLNPLALKDVIQLISDTLKVSADEVNNLAMLVQHKTGGNPFFVNQFLNALYEDKLFIFNHNAERWTWDVAEIEKREMTDNVIELVASKLQKLAPESQQVLKLAACIGNQFDLGILSVVNEAFPSEAAADLWPALQEELVSPIGDGYKFTRGEDSVGTAESVAYRFLHDRVQQAAYSLIAAEDKPALHLKIGQLMWANSTPDEVEERVFDITNQLNIGAELLANSTEKKQLAELNLAAAKKAKATIAYEAALKYTATGIDLLADNCWSSAYKLTISLYTEQLECAYLYGDFATAGQSFEVAIKQARSNVEKANLYTLRVAMFTTQGQFQEALLMGKEALAFLQIQVPSPGDEIDVVPDLMQVEANLGGRRIAELVDAPDMVDEEKILASGLIIRLMASAYFIDQNLFTLLVLKAVNLSLEHGNTVHSAYAYAIYGTILGAGMGNYEASYQFGLLSFELDDKFGNLLRHRTYHNFGTFINHFRVHARKNLNYLRKGFQYGVENGDLIYAGYCGNVVIYYRSLLGHPLADIYTESEKYLDFVQRAKDRDTAANLIVSQRMIQGLQGKATEPGGFGDETYDEAEHVAHMQNIVAMKLSLSWYYILKTRSLYLFEKYEAALQAAQQSEQLLIFSFGLLQVPEHYFYYSLTLAALWAKVSPADQETYLKLLTKHQEQMKIWADNAPDNFLHKYLLIAAEIARIRDQDYEALDLYDQAISAAAAAEYTQNQALANELAAKFYLTKDKPKIARVYLLDARYGYLRWGATAKVDHLETTYPAAFRQSDAVALDTTISTTATASTTQSLSSKLDLNSVLKASQAISGEIVLNTLVSKLLQIIIENAGAQNGFLILEQEGHWGIEAEAKVRQDQIEVTALRPNPIDASNRLSSAIVNYVARTQEDVVLNDATREGPFTQDDYITSNQSKSILCSPLINQGKLTAILYLENNLTTGAFTPDRLKVLNLLSAQAAISIENANLYTNLEQSEKKYRTIFEASKDTIFVTAPSGAIIDINLAGLQLFGLTREEAMKTNALEIYVNPDDRLEFRRQIEVSGHIRDFEVKLRKNNDTQMECLVSAVVRRADDGTILGYQGIIQDITQRKQAELERLQLSAIQTELALAKEIQQSLLPPSKPDWPDLNVICYSTPAREMGGDLYAYHAFVPSTETGEDDKKQEKYAIMVGDVSGKGIPAALLMAVSLTSFQSSITRNLAPSELFIQLDQIIGSYTGETRQNCAMVYTEFSYIDSPSDRKQRVEMRVANAGCITPVIRRTNGSIEWVQVYGIPLGTRLGAELGYLAETVILNPGDLVILTSDGVVEAQNADDEMFDFGRLEEAVASGPYANPEAMLTHLRATVDSFVGHIEAHDDLTIVVVQV